MTVGACQRMDFTFMPKIESDWIGADLVMPFGTAVADTERVQARMLEAAHEAFAELGAEAVHGRGIYARVGGSGGAGVPGQNQGPGASGSHLAEVRVSLVPLDRRPFSSTEFARVWREKIGEIAGVESLKLDYSLGAGSGPAMDFELSHSNAEVLHSAARRLAAALGAYDGVRDVDDGFADGKPQLDFQIRPDATSVGLSELELARQLRSAFYGTEAVRQQRGRDEVRVYVRRPLRERQSLHDVEQFMIQTPQGGEMPLAQAASLTPGHADTGISRRDGRRVVHVTGDVVEGVANGNRVFEDVVKTDLPAILDEDTFERAQCILSGKEKTPLTVCHQRPEWPPLSEESAGTRGPPPSVGS
jgi:multidrug efflux pump subunit AcrB